MAENQKLHLFSAIFLTTVFAIIFALHKPYSPQEKCLTKREIGRIHKQFPADAVLKEIFVEEKSKFEKLVKMSDEDPNVTRIAYDFTWISGEKNSGETGIDRPTGFSPEKWEEYKNLFSEIGLSAGILWSVETGEVDFIAYTFGFLDSGVTKGYIYTKEKLNCTNESMDDWKSLPAEHFYCKEIEPNWYIYLSR